MNDSTDAKGNLPSSSIDVHGEVKQGRSVAIVSRLIQSKCKSSLDARKRSHEHTNTAEEMLGTLRSLFDELKERYPCWIEDVSDLQVLLRKYNEFHLPSNIMQLEKELEH